MPWCVQQGKSESDVKKRIFGVGQLILAMLVSFVSKKGSHTIHGIAFTPVEVSHVITLW